MARRALSLIAFAVPLGVLVLFAAPLLVSLLWPGQGGGGERPRALIVDTVCMAVPNEALIGNITKLLESRGFEVEACAGANVTVDFMRRLALGNYKLIVLRVHSTRMNFQGLFLPNGTVVIITGERFRPDKYRNERLLEYLVPSTVDPELRLALGYWAITPRFVRALKGRFPRTVVIAMGCSTLYTSTMAQAFIDKGAAAYIGWSDYVRADHMDKALALLLKLLLVDGLTIGEAVDKVNDVVGPDPDRGATLIYYPPHSGGLTISDIVKP
ncbi:MAG: hypothetical protein DRJ56_05940 [Thermoprotei archaeon]|nr:MAG: hypothetical protein DRJ56_05940 [Thermoprotei archaeon]